jgi:hypothetical protein
MELSEDAPRARPMLYQASIDPVCLHPRPPGMHGWVGYSCQSK